LTKDKKMYISAENARKLCTSILVASGLSTEHASIITDNLILAELRGIGSHGMSRMAVYCSRIKNGLINKNPKISILKETPATAVIDGDNGPGQVVGLEAMDICIKKASSCGTGICSVRNGSHFGIAAYYAMKALEHDMIGVALSNAPATMGPWGGITPMIGTNPFCFAIPAGRHRPIVLDCATSIVARGKIILAEKEGKPIPDNWAMDKWGNPTTNASEALKGSVLPFGTYKGYGLALVIDILCALLSGASFGIHIGDLYNNTDAAQNLGFFLMAIDIKSFVNADIFKQQVDQMTDEIKACRKAVNTNEIYVPGEIEYNNEIANRERGIEIGQGVLSDLCRLAEEYSLGMDPLELIYSL